jgi:hypothetical protein
MAVLYRRIAHRELVSSPELSILPGMTKVPRSEVVSITNAADLVYWCEFFECTERELKTVLRFTDETPDQVRKVIDSERKRR